MSTTTYTAHSRPCASCGLRRCLPSCLDRLEPHDGLSITGVIRAVEAPQMPAKPTAYVPRVPVGGIVMIVLGLALMGIGFVLRDETAWLIYDMIHGRK